MTSRIALKPIAVSACVALLPRSLWACAACYGQSDSAMAAGMNWGILSLLGMIVVVLGGVAGFFFFLIRRSTASAEGTQAALAASWGANWPVPAESAGAFEDEPLPRGGLKRESSLARQRKNCAPAPVTATPLAVSRSRS